MLEAVGESDIAPETVSAEQHVLQSERIDQGMQVIDEEAEAQMARGIIGLPVSAEIGGDGVVSPRKPGNEAAPCGVNGAEKSRQQNQRLPRAVFFVMDGGISGKDVGHGGCQK